MQRTELARNVTVHTHASGEGAIFVNAYLVETANGVVAIDATLSESESKALRKEFEASRQASSRGPRHAPERRMVVFLPNGGLKFLIGMNADPIARELNGVK